MPEIKIDKKPNSFFEEIVKRHFIEREPIAKLAKEYGVTHQTLFANLRKRKLPFISNIKSNKEYPVKIYKALPLLYEYSREYNIPIEKLIKDFNLPSDIKRLLQDKSIFNIKRDENTINIINNISTWAKNNNLEVKVYQEEPQDKITFDLSITNKSSNITLYLNIIDKRFIITKETYWKLDKIKSFIKEAEELVKKDKSKRLLFIYESEFQNKREALFSFILEKLNLFKTKISAQGLEIIKIPKTEAFNFIEENYLLPPLPTTEHILGLYNPKDKEIYSVITLIKSRFRGDYYEINRYVNKKFIKVEGALNKLIKYISSNISNKLITYATKRLYDINSIPFIGAGFKIEDETPYSYAYFDFEKNIILSRLLFTKSKQKQKLPKYNTSLSEIDNMLLNNYGVIFYPGNYFLKYIKNS